MGKIFKAGDGVSKKRTIEQRDAQYKELQELYGALEVAYENEIVSGKRMRVQIDELQRQGTRQYSEVGKDILNKEGRLIADGYPQQQEHASPSLQNPSATSKPITLSQMIKEVTQIAEKNAPNFTAPAKSESNVDMFKQ